MVKRINNLIFIVIAIVLFVSILFKYKEFSDDKELFNKLISEVESNLITEYKKILKESVQTTILMIDSTYERVLKNNTKLMKDELTRVLEEIKNYDKDRISKYIANYKHSFIVLTSISTNNLVNQHVTLNNHEFYISIKDKRINEIFTDAIKNFLYKNITTDNKYTWVNKILHLNGGDDYAIRLIHPNLKSTEGQFLSTNTLDIKGNRPYLEELNGIKNNKEIFFRYYFKVLNSDEISEKLTYAKLYEKKNWIVATGIPLKNLQKSIEQKKVEVTKLFKRHFVEAIAFQSIILIIFLILLFFLRSKLISYFKQSEKLKEQLSRQLTSKKEEADSFFNMSINLQVVADLNGKILDISNSSTFILGYRKEELINKSFLDLVHPEDIEKTISEMTILKQGEVVYYFENRYKHKDGYYIPLAWSANPNENRTLIYASAHDKSKLKEKEEIIFQQSKMASMGEMIESIAHQWRQPLSIVSTISTGIKLKSEFESLDTKDLQESMDKINFSVQHLSQTVDDFRGFFNSNKQVVSFNILECLEKTLKLASSQLKSSNIKIIKNIEDISFIGLENELVQVLINIMNNARDELIKKDDFLRIISIETKNEDKSLKIIITDNAGGIPQHVLPKIFESHFTTKDTTKGTGIGLYMSKLIIEENMKGKIIAKNVNFSHDNRDCYGAEFTIILPFIKGKNK